MANVVIEGNSRAECKTRIAISPRLATSRRDIGRGGGGAIVEVGGAVWSVRGERLFYSRTRAPCLLYPKSITICKASTNFPDVSLSAHLLLLFTRCPYVLLHTLGKHRGPPELSPPSPSPGQCRGDFRHSLAQIEYHRQLRDRSGFYEQNLCVSQTGGLIDNALGRHLTRVHPSWGNPITKAQRLSRSSQQQHQNLSTGSPLSYPIRQTPKMMHPHHHL
jgi:hypothetical protein